MPREIRPQPGTPNRTINLKLTRSEARYLVELCTKVTAVRGNWYETTKHQVLNAIAIRLENEIDEINERLSNPEAH